MCIIFDENVWISVTISAKFVSKVPIDSNPALAKSLYEPVLPWLRDTCMHHSTSMS